MLSGLQQSQTTEGSWLLEQHCSKTHAPADYSRCCAVGCDVVLSEYVVGLVASLRVFGYGLEFAAGTLPEIDVTQLRHDRTHGIEVWQELHVSPCLACSSDALSGTKYS